MRAYCTRNSLPLRLGQAHSGVTPDSVAVLAVPPGATLDWFQKAYSHRCFSGTCPSVQKHIRAPTSTETSHLTVELTTFLMQNVTRATIYCLLKVWDQQARAVKARFDTSPKPRQRKCVAHSPNGP